MTLVHEEVGGQWHFVPEKEIYYREKEGGINAKIFGRYLPNPAEIKQKSGRIATDATKALWEHWNAYNNA